MGRRGEGRDGWLIFFKQKTAYEILRDWSSDVCSSDLGGRSPCQGLSSRARPQRYPVRVLPLPGASTGSLVSSQNSLGELSTLVSRSSHSGLSHHRSEERRVGKECRSRWSPYP